MQKCLLIILLATITKQSDLYDVMSSNVSKLTDRNWMNNLEKGIQKDRIFLVHFYNDDNGVSYNFSKEMNEKADKFKGILDFAFVNCIEQKSLCGKEAPKNLPALKLYLPVPLPSQVFELDLKKAINTAVRYIQNHVTVLTEENMQGFLKSDPTLPKVVFFSDNDRVSLVYKSLAMRLREKMSFGFATKALSDLTDMYDVKKFPSLILLKNGEKKPFRFKGNFDYKDMFDFLNVFSEQFVPQNAGGNEEDKPWIFQAVPELHAKSAKEVCIDLAKTLCVVVFSPGVPSKETLDSLKDLQKSLENKKRSVSLKFMWINSKVHKDWVKDLQIEEPDKLSVRVLRTGRRSKFITMDKEFSPDNINDLIEKILGGDARSNSLRNGIPAFSTEL